MHPTKGIVKVQIQTQKVVNSSNQSYKLIQPKSYKIAFQPQSSNHIHPTKLASLIRPSCKSMEPRGYKLHPTKVINSKSIQPNVVKFIQPSCRSIQPRLYKLHPTPKITQKNPSKPKLQINQTKVTKFIQSC